MRALLSKVLTGSMVAGAALLVAACGGEGDTAANNATTELDTDATLNAGDGTGIDAATGADANMSMDVNMTDTNASANVTTDAGNATNGM